MRMLVELEERKEKVSVGRYAGQMSNFTIAIAGDKYCWNICRINKKKDGENYPPIGVKFFKGFVHLLPCLEYFSIDFYVVVPKIISALQEKTNIENKPNIEGKKDPKEIGKIIDDFFKCNYLNENHNPNKESDPRRIYTRVLKDDKND